MSGEETRWWPSRVLAFGHGIFQKPLNPNLPIPRPKQAAYRPNERTILKHPPEKQYLAQTEPSFVADIPLPSFDAGVFDNKIIEQRLYPIIDPSDPSAIQEPKGNIRKDTSRGTQIALTHAVSRIEQTFSSMFDVLGVEPTLPRYRTLEEQRALYQFSSYPTTADGEPAQYPPYLEYIPSDQSTQVLLKKITPDEGDILGRTREWFLEKERAVAFGGEPEKGVSIQDVVDYNKYHRKFGPILNAAFTTAAKANNYGQWATILAKSDPESLFVQDGSYFRKAVGVSDPTAVLHHKEPLSDECWTVGAVNLFELHENGKLHPSVTIFNKQMSPSQDSTNSEKEDWPWRYAKTCAQHFVEEAIIVAANRSLSMDHPVYRQLYPHWYKTLSLNAAARSTLLPQIIVDIWNATASSRTPTIRTTFVGSYVPNDLERRGFPTTQLGLSHPRYRNYPYAKNALALWISIRAYVKSMLQIPFPSDIRVAEDKNIQRRVTETKTAAHIPTFPDIVTLDALVDAVTMCIFIASPFHTAVNYLQNFYQVFVIAEPPALCSAPPTTLKQLQSYQEHDLVAALPITRQRQWLLAAQLPWLLSFKVEPDRSLLNYAASQWHVHKYKCSEDAMRVTAASERLYFDLQRMQRAFFRNSLAMDKGSVPYMVLDPGFTTVSILI
ncbi:lipoxygenase [Corynascus novoguineensis]|uniref:Manganese lipoxygenase n=1 Tax=Corynascus novoguineensis TaxID=1126955 RepID=A0AAN7CQF5_9PEZI|nr:lipoxygenase [Corynascus novoguineensis]